jgi:hypothetical protein
LLATFITPMVVGSVVAAAGVLAAVCFRRIPRRDQR